MIFSKKYLDRHFEHLIDWSLEQMDTALLPNAKALYILAKASGLDYLAEEGEQPLGIATFPLVRI